MAVKLGINGFGQPTLFAPGLNCTCRLSKGASMDVVCVNIKEAPMGPVAGISGFTDWEVVSADLVACSSSIYDVSGCIACTESFVKFVSCRDIESGYSNCIVNSAVQMAQPDGIVPNPGETVSIKAQEMFDPFGHPTAEVELLTDVDQSRAAVPSSVDVRAYEADKLQYLTKDASPSSTASLSEAFDDDDSEYDFEPKDENPKESYSFITPRERKSFETGLLSDLIDMDQLMVDSMEDAGICVSDLISGLRARV